MPRGGFAAAKNVEHGDRGPLFGYDKSVRKHASSFAQSLMKARQRQLHLHPTGHMKEDTRCEHGNMQGLILLAAKVRHTLEEVPADQLRVLAKGTVQREKYHTLCSGFYVQGPAAYEGIVCKVQTAAAFKKRPGAFLLLSRRGRGTSRGLAKRLFVSMAKRTAHPCAVGSGRAL